MSEGTRYKSIGFESIDSIVPFFFSRSPAQHTLESRIACAASHLSTPAPAKRKVQPNLKFSSPRYSDKPATVTKIHRANQLLKVLSDQIFVESAFSNNFGKELSSFSILHQKDLCLGGHDFFEFNDVEGT